VDDGACVGPCGHVQVEANLEPGRLQLCFDLEKADAAIRPSPAAASPFGGEDPKNKKGKGEEPGPNKKKREKVGYECCERHARSIFACVFGMTQLAGDL